MVSEYVKVVAANLRDWMGLARTTKLRTSKTSEATDNKAAL
jgi:hypothetical protein